MLPATAPPTGAGRGLEDRSGGLQEAGMVAARTRRACPCVCHECHTKQRLLVNCSVFPSVPDALQSYLVPSRWIMREDLTVLWGV